MELVAGIVIGSLLVVDLVFFFSVNRALDDVITVSATLQESLNSICTWINEKGWEEDKPVEYCIGFQVPNGAEDEDEEDE